MPRCSLPPSALLLALLACAGEPHAPLDELSGDPARFTWQVPANIAPPPVPAGNPMSFAKVELGRRLFYDPRLSGNGAFACSSCHRQDLAFTDAKNISVGSTGEAHTRNAQGLANAGYQGTLGWAGPNTHSLESQALIPMFGDAPIELGLKGQEAALVARLGAEPIYQSLFPKSFPSEPGPISVANVTRAIAAFQRTFISFNAPIDRFRRGDANAISAAAKRGEQLFGLHRCVACHEGLLLTAAAHIGPSNVPIDAGFANTGLYNVGGTGAYPTHNSGLFEATRDPGDMGRMKIPSLRNVAITFPYMHDGSVGT
ncbi:MAG: di-heme enzyme, partial [Cytophagaceae bacterium]|nr:di-heme enzyme [Gemmatimonadaceae bacterium]